PIVGCTVVLEVPDPVDAARVLDVHYRRDGDAWVEMFAVRANEDILRATLAIDGNRIQVETHSEPRLDRVLGVLREVLPGARIISERRDPLVPGELPTAPTRLGAGENPGLEAPAEIQALLERQ